MILPFKHRFCGAFLLSKLLLIFKTILEPLYLSILIAGFGGGLVRGLVGYIKNHLNSASTKFEYLYFLLMMFLSGVVGLLSAAAVNGLDLPLFGSTVFTPVIAFVVGYAGGDLLENIYKIILKKPTLV